METVDAEYKEAAPLAVLDAPTPPATLFGTDDPIAIISKATAVANALVAVIEQKKLITVIQGKKYPQVEAWQTMGAMLSICSVCEWSRRVEGGWEARVVIYNRYREIIGSAEAQCLKIESGKGRWEDYAIRSMAQTRATSKAYRSNLAYIMVLAGYEATPAEEMGNIPEAAGAPPAPPPVSPKPKYTREEEIKLDRTRRLKEVLRQARAHGCEAPFGLRVTDGPSLREWAQAETAGCDDWIAGTQPTLEQIEHMERAMALIEEQLGNAVPF